MAATVRATALVRRRLGAAGARDLAAAPHLEEAVATLVATPYGHDVRATQGLAEAQHAVAATLLWHVRVLAGWTPRPGADLLRSLAGAFEVANVDEHLRAMTGAPRGPTFPLGSLATAWGQLATTSSPEGLRAALAASAWGDPGGESPADVRLGMRLSWLNRVSRASPLAQPWAAGAVALLLARHTHLAGRLLSPAHGRLVEPLVGAHWGDAPSLPAMAAALPPDASWALLAVAAPEDLWRAEAAWWHRVERDGFALVRRNGFGPATVVGAIAVLAVDAWRVRAALEVAARVGPAARGVFDAVA